MYMRENVELIECVLITESERTLVSLCWIFEQKICRIFIKAWYEIRLYTYFLSNEVKVKLGSGGILVKWLYHLFIFAAFDIDWYHILLHIYELRLRFF